MDITMPQLGETVTEGTVTRWLKQVGEQVGADELIFEVSTDKVDSEVPSPGAGYLVEILVPEGETVPVGTRLAVLGDAPPAGGEAAAPAAEDAAPAAEAPAAPPQEAAPAPAAETPAPAPAAEAPAPAADAPPASTPAPEPEPAPAPQPAAAPAPARQPAPAAASSGDGGGNGSSRGAGMLLSPVVRRLVAENNLDPASITGTGEGGRITRNDVLSYLDKAPRTAAPAAAPAQAPAAPAQASAPAQAPAPAPAASAPAPAPARGDEVVPWDNIRRRTAEHMVRSKATSPHVLTAVEVDFERVDAVRRAHRDAFKAAEGFSLTYLPFVSRAVCDALREFPHINASVSGESLVVHGSVNLGIAVDVDQRGLIVPVVKAAEGKRLRQIAREISDLAARARTKKLTPDDVASGTFTITNPGPYGTLISAPVINQPQVAILSTEGVKKRPVVVETPAGDAIAIHPVGYLAMSWDHRAIDGAYASAFLNRLRQILETRDWEAELA